AERIGRRLAEQFGRLRPTDRPAIHIAMIRLLELIAVHGIIEEIREVGKQVESVFEPISGALELTAGKRRRIVERQTVALRLAAIAVIERAVASDDALIDRALCNLIGGI